MTVLSALSVTLEVPDVEPGIGFYTDAGLIATRRDGNAYLRCAGRTSDSIELLGGGARKRLHHISLRADNLDDIAARVPAAGGRLVEAARESQYGAVWVEDPHGMLIELSDRPADPPPGASAPFEINGPGRWIRNCRSAMRPGTSYGPVQPLQLGHILVFSPDVMESVRFMTEALGMGLADHAQDVIAFCCAVKNSDHHVVAFAKSPGVGFHHVSFQVSDPDEVGRGGRTLADKSGRGDWGFGRHTIGSNFFHYIQDPWGSWLEYYCDMDYIDDYTRWTPRNYDLGDSLANWGPPVPDDFVHNYEVDEKAVFAA